MGPIKIAINNLNRGVSGSFDSTVTSYILRWAETWSSLVEGDEGISRQLIMDNNQVCLTFGPILQKSSMDDL